MGLRVAAGLAAVLGGLTWMAVPWWGGPSLWWCGLALLALACLALGAGLVRRGVALRLVVAAASLTLVGCVWSLVRGSGEAGAVDVVTGATALGAGLLGLHGLRRRHRRVTAAHAHRPGRGMARHAA